MTTFDCKAHCEEHSDWLAEEEARREYAEWLAEQACLREADRRQEEEETIRVRALSSRDRADWWVNQNLKRLAGAPHTHHCRRCGSVGFCDADVCHLETRNDCPDCVHAMQAA